MSRYISLSSLYFFFLISANVCLAQSREDSSSYRDLNPVVVTGTRFELEKRKVPGTVTVITREEIERHGNINILPIVSLQVPGVFLNNRSLIGFGVGPNSGGNISIRGISGSPNSRILVLIDGQPQYMGIFAHPIADAYSSTDFEKAEVIRGASSLLYGSNALGGAINLITRKPSREGWQGTGKLGYGSFNTAYFSGSMGYKKDNFHTFFSINRSRTDGYRQEGKDEFKNTTGFFKMGYSFGPTIEISGDIQGAEASYFHPGTTQLPLENDQRDYFRGRAAISLKNSFDEVDGGLFFFYNWGNHQFKEGFESSDLNRGFTFYQNVHLFPATTITLGLDYKNFGGKAQNDNLPPPARVGFGETHHMDERDLYISIQQELAEKISLQGGVRWTNNSIYGANLLPTAGINFQFTKSTYLKTLFSTAFRSPAIVDLYLFPTSNRELQPEEVSNVELGITQVLLDKKLEVELIGFYNEGNNLIQVNPAVVPPVARNSGSFTNKGLESQVKFYPSTNWDILLNYSRIDVSENILYSPRQMVNLQLNYELERVSVAADLQQISGLRNSLLPDDQAQDYLMINLRGKYFLTDYLQIFLEGNNLMDASYEVEKGYPMPGVNLMGGLFVKF